MLQFIQDFINLINHKSNSKWFIFYFTKTIQFLLNAKQFRALVCGRNDDNNYYNLQSSINKLLTYQ